MIHFDIPNIVIEIKILEEETKQEEFWNNSENSTIVLTKLKRLQKKLEKYTKLENEIKNLEDLNDLLINELDEEIAKEVLRDTEKFKQELDRMELETLLNDKYDKNNAIITLHPGAGGTESQDWVQILYRMYSKWAISNEFFVKELDFIEGLDAGIKSVTLLISGENAYGYLKGEMGVHRLVRISPFDSGGRRHTSFASLEILPEISDDIEFEINLDDLRIDTYRASGARWTTY